MKFESFVLITDFVQGPGEKMTFVQVTSFRNKRSVILLIPSPAISRHRDRILLKIREHGTLQTNPLW